jgi:membrane peptidoglycan carboxypeptidase
MSAQNSKPVGVLGAIAGFLGFSVVAGVLVTAMVAPALAVTGVAANSTTGVFEELPDFIEITGQTQRNTVWATQGGQPVELASVFDEDREDVSWENVSQFAKDAAVAGEDERFYEHGGVDLAGIARAAVNNITSSGKEGASTITQQLVKNLLLNEARASYPADSPELAEALDEAAGVSLERKLREAKLAIGLEKRYSKDEILLAYLNIANFGGNTYGIESAAQKYYSVSAKDLTAAQAASLLAIVQYPSARRPDFAENYAANQARRDAILNSMNRLGMLDQAQLDEALATPVNETTLKISDIGSGCYYAVAAKYFCAYAVNEALNSPSLGATPEERQAAWKRGGYDVYTTIDLDQNANAEQILATQTPATETRFQLGSAVSTVEVGTGRILVMAQNKIYDSTDAAASDSTKTSINFNTDASNGGSSGFQVGSTYKLFTLVNWLQNGHGLSETVNGAPATYDLDGECWNNKPTLFKNDNNAMLGRMNVISATSGSVNAAFANMASKLDICSIRDTAKSMGVHTATGADLNLYPTFFLGTDTIAPLTMANAYATVANKGVLCQPIAIDRFVDRDGAELPGQSADCKQAITPEVAAGAAKALQAVMAGGTGAAANPRDGTPLIGKTGTADAISTMIASASTEVASVAWVGNIVGTQSLRRISVKGVQAAQLRFSIMRPIQASLDKSVYGTGAAKFPEPPASIMRGNTQAVPNLAGQTTQQAKTTLQGLGLVYVEGDTVESDLEAGRVAGTTPEAGNLVSRGSRVTVQISDGSLVPEETTVPEIVGTPLVDAWAALTGAGLDPAGITVTFEQGDPAEECRVTASDPAPGAPLAGAVSLTVNGGDTPDSQPDCQ